MPDRSGRSRTTECIEALSCRCTGLALAVGWLAELPEAAADLVDEDLGLLEGGEVSALGGLVPVADVDETLLGPPSRWPLELLREDRGAGRNGDRVDHGSGDPFVDPADALPVQAP